MVYPNNTINQVKVVGSYNSKIDNQNLKCLITLDNSCGRPILNELGFVNKSSHIRIFRSKRQALGYLKTQSKVKITKLDHQKLAPNFKNYFNDQFPGPVKIQSYFNSWFK